jgi:non-specific serine/threonine protein kinase/serine/threonine-protein kinase
VGTLVRKHQAGVAFAAPLVVLLLGFAVTMALQADRIARERDRAAEAARTAERTLDFTMGLLDVYDPHDAAGNAVAAREMLDRSLAKIEQELEDQPLAQAHLLVNAGRLYRKMGLNDQARDVVERGLTALSGLLGENHPDTLQAEAELAYLYFYDRRFEEAEPLFVHAIAGFESRLGPDDPLTLQTQKNLANLYTYRGDYDEAEGLHLQLLKKLREVLGDDDPTTLRAINELGILYRVSGRLDEAEPLLVEALASQRHVMGDGHPFTLSSMNSLAVLYLMQSRLDEAESLFRECFQRKRVVLGDSHPSTLKTAYNLACVVARGGRSREALDILAQAADHGMVFERIGSDPDLASLRGDPEFEAIVARAGGRTGAD